jgi:pyruvate dehydrogenase E1 component beta subunit
VIDPRTTSPLDEDAILESVERTGRLVIVDERRRAAASTDIAPSPTRRSPR